jgi:hypothetical protein
MARPVPVWSQRLLRKGSFAEETYNLFAQWNFEQRAAGNLAKAFSGQFKTRGWEVEVRATTAGRLRDFDAVRPLVRLARAIPFAEWRDCYRLWITATEEPYGIFVLKWLHHEREAGRFQLRADELRPFVQTSWAEAGKPPLSEYGQVRAGRDLVKLAVELGLLTGSSVIKTLGHPGLSDRAFLFHVYLIAEFEGTPAKVVESPYWRSSFMAPSEVHHTLLRLHQYRKVDYQVAGSLVQLSLPHPNSLAFAEAMAA